MAGVVGRTERKTERKHTTGVTAKTERAVTAPEATIAAPETYKMIFENEFIRVLDINLKKGKEAPMHSHPAYFAYALSSCKVRFTSADGKSQEVDMKAGDVQWREAEAHRSDNIGESDC